MTRWDGVVSLSLSADHQQNTQSQNEFRISPCYIYIRTTLPRFTKTRLDGHSKTMKLDRCWHMEVFLETWSEQCQTLFSFAKITQKRLRKSSGNNPLGQPRIKHIPLPIQTPTELPAPPDLDPFSAQLAACREQSWWDPQPTSDLLSDSDDSNSYYSSISDNSEYNSIDLTSPKRSISIREIRERMNSQQSMRSCLSAGRYEFEPGLKLLDEVRDSWRDLGGWRDMETFAD